MNKHPLTVLELKNILNQHPDDMEIIYDRCSDYENMEAGDIYVVDAVSNESGWVMRSHPTMSRANKARRKKYLHFPGN